MDKANGNNNTTEDSNVLLSVENLKMWFPVYQGLFQRKTKAWVKAVNDVSFSLNHGETLGLVGESGCGKTTVGRCVLSLYKATGGKVLFENVNIAELTKKENYELRRKMQIIFQDPYSSLNPRMTLESLIGDPMIVQKLVKNKKELREKVIELLEIVGLNADMVLRYPHQFSGGQRQRIGIARALAVNPRFIVCDEAVSALDVSIQAQIVNLFKKLQKNLNLTYLFIAHDLAVVRHISDFVAVMYLGHIVEIAPADLIYTKPAHPYTRSLLSAVPIPDPAIETKRERILLSGEIPSPLTPPEGCVFHTRCPFAKDECKNHTPPLTERNAGHRVACLFY